MELEQKEIANCWGVYKGPIGMGGFGKIIDEEENLVKILYLEGIYGTEGRHNHCGYWNKNCLTRFKTPEEAVKYHIKNIEECSTREKQLSPEEIMKQARESFPSYFIEENGFKNNLQDFPNDFSI